MAHKHKSYFKNHLQSTDEADFHYGGRNKG